MALGKKTGGRLKGSQNKITSDLKERWAEFVSYNFDDVQGWFNKAVSVDPVEGLKLYLQFSERILPKLSSQNVDLTSGGEPIRTPNIIIPGPETQP